MNSNSKVLEACSQWEHREGQKALGETKASQKSSLTLCVLQDPLHQHRVLCDALGDKQDALWDPSAAGQQVAVSDLEKYRHFYIHQSFYLRIWQFKIYTCIPCPYFIVTINENAYIVTAVCTSIVNCHRSGCGEVQLTLMRFWSPNERTLRVQHKERLWAITMCACSLFAFLTYLPPSLLVCTVAPKASGHRAILSLNISQQSLRPTVHVCEKENQRRIW